MLNDSLSYVSPYYIGTVVGTSPLIIPADWEIVFLEVSIGSGNGRIIPLTIMRGGISSGHSYGYRNGYYDGAGNYAFVQITSTFKTDGSLSIVIDYAKLTGTEYATTSRLSASYLRSLGRIS